MGQMGATYLQPGDTHHCFNCTLHFISLISSTPTAPGPCNPPHHVCRSRDTADVLVGVAGSTCCGAGVVGEEHHSVGVRRRPPALSCSPPGEMLLWPAPVCFSVVASDPASTVPSAHSNSLMDPVHREDCKLPEVKRHLRSARQSLYIQEPRREGGGVGGPGTGAGQGRGGRPWDRCRTGGEEGPEHRCRPGGGEEGPGTGAGQGEEGSEHRCRPGSRMQAAPPRPTCPHLNGQL